ncbi:bifunctional adenosylcobinamide kinase/adenosylcobinamide-phosphate guanylyltransferase [Longimicrobium sp.]|uniref:bifunctional adenosylcobinamide kinase/adenosylcobinamide-phosphate guanylyltransferase n=1 Tax=Longimicrobium sp. TaxID=2029185 RepID=UPI002E36A9B4|nr:bifunctional adenosylcobinamide kinase/adenosylcobinamide-phosphate guanylyltransferase [Longimicrobium sp.]HEX6042563.1 bifunctional adenosylcobinamide kinase/adenosylcobinamide-phosphate guanylyltransferase [Longimicrobium sp.]
MPDRVPTGLVAARLVLGPRNCGKSAAVEARLAGYPHLLYVGTLWNEPRYGKTLREHRVRRGDRWDLLEVTGDLEADAHALAARAAEMGRPGAVLVDGLTTWAARIAVTHGRMMQGVLDLAETLAFCARQFPDLVWCWVDAVEEPDAESLPYARALWKRLRERVPSLVVETWPPEGTN